MLYNHDLHHRHSIRLSGYDYGQAGTYYVTICTFGRLHHFGEVHTGTMISNHAGRMIESWLGEISHKFPSVAIDSSIVMPDHIHALIGINDHKAGAHTGAPLHNEINDNSSVGADLRVCPPRLQRNANDVTDYDEGAHTGAPLHDEITDNSSVGADLRVCPPRNADDRPTLPTIIQWFKTMTTNAYIRGIKQHNWPPFEKKLWQRNYYERVIRDETELDAVRRYITGNPVRWTKY